MQQATPLRFLALGDSYTVGEGIFLEESWPHLLARRLTSSGFPCSPPEVIAKTGWSSDELLAAIETANPQGPYDVITLMIGVNNQYRGWNPDDMCRDVRTTLFKAVDLVGGRNNRIFVISIPDWGTSPFGQTKNPEAITPDILLFSEMIAIEARRRRTNWIDITDFSELALHFPEFNAADHLHPSGAMHHLWMERIAPVVLKQLQPAMEAPNAEATEATTSEET
jgi:lysophospholipase L1-like esterase